VTLNALSRPPALMPNNSDVDEMVSGRSLAEDHIKTGRALDNAGQYSAAIKEFQAAANLTPENKDLNYFIASAYFKTGQMALAHEYYQKCSSGSTYDSVCQNSVSRTAKAARQEAKKAEVAKQKESHDDPGKSSKDKIHAFK
jgi:tetratricopeptide (TPR) repeat protein